MSTPGELWALGGTPQPVSFYNWGTVVSEHVDNATTRLIEITEYELNVKDAGVAGDGTTDDTTALAAAFATAASTGRVAYVPPGTYVCADVDVPDDAVIRGKGTLRRSDGVSAQRVLTITGSNITIDGVKIDGNAAEEGTDTDFAIHNTGVGNSNIEIRNCEFTNLYGGGIRLQNTAGQVRIIDNRIVYGTATTGGTGILMNSQGGGAPDEIVEVTIRGNRISRHADTVTGGYGMMIRGSDDNETRLVRDVDISGNYVDLTNGDPDGSGIGIEIWADYANVENNRVRGGSFGISHSGRHGTIVGNNVANVPGLGIESVSQHTVVANNTITNVLCGIAAWGSGATPWVHQGICITGNRIYRAEPCINCSSPDATITGNNCTVYKDGGSLNYGIWVDEAPRCTVVGNRIQLAADNAGSNPTGIRFNNPVDFTVSGNRVGTPSVPFTYGMRVSADEEAQNGVITSNNFADCTTPLSFLLTGTATLGDIQQIANRGIKPTVSGSRGGNAALADLLTELGTTLGIITDSSS